MNTASQNNKDESFDIKPYALKALQYWYLFAIALLVSSGYAYYKVRYSVPVYKVDARIVIKDEYSSWGQEYFLPGLELVSGRNRLVNEVGAIRSFPLMRKVIDELPEFRVWYYDIGNIKSTGLYRSSPFVVQWDSIQDRSLFGKSFYVKILSPKRFVIGINQDVELEGKKFYFGESFELNNNKLTIKLRQPYNYEFFKDKLYRFTINNLDRLAISYQGGLGISTEEKESSILLISRQGTQMDKEIDFINKFLEVYIRDGLEKNNQIATNVMQFVDDQINEILNTLIISENKLENFKSRINFNRIDLEGERLIPEITTLEKNKLDMEFNINYHKQILDYIQNNDDARGIIVPSFVTRNSVLFQLLEKLIAAYSKKMKLSYAVTTSNDAWKQLLEEIKVSKRIIIENLKATLEKQKIDLDNLDKQIEFIESKMQDVPSAEREYFNIQRDYKLNNDLYTFLLKKRAEASIAKGSNVPQAHVLDWATPYRVSFVGPNTSKIYNTSIIIGLVITSLIVFLLEYFNEKIADKKELEKCTKIPVLAIVGHNKNESDLVVANHPISLISESFRSMRTNINYMVAGKEKFCVLITSSVSAEGKTFCSINLASAFAILGKKTVILGADLRKPKIFQDFDLKNDKGISSYLINKADLSEIIQPAQYENIDIISAGPIPPNPSELISNKNMENLIAELRGLYDVIIIDTPPLGLLTDALLLTKYSDVNLYIVRHNFTKRRQLSLVNEYYEDNKIQNIGIVVNDLQQRKINYWGGYGFDFGYGYDYSYDGEEKQKKKSVFGRLFSYNKV